ncbi:type VII secretion protein EssB [Jeotgalibacillus proteolyticus]|uniref:type VII secretion protein EssB n=1 Tax=Jeotgalibacillus proteolyticus TaxID=2082395 RepID=UPI003CF775BD
MTEPSHTYLEDRLDAKVEHKDDHVFIFQQTKIKLVNEIEIHLIKTVHPELKKEILSTEDEVTITVQAPDSFHSFSSLHKKSALARWTFALRLVHFAEQKRSKRLHPIYSPDNIILDRSNVPYLLHYGVEESLPPYEKDQDLQFNEIKATILYALDPSKSFKDYLNLYHTMQLTPVMKELREASDIKELKELVIKQIDQEEQQQKTFTHVPNKAWKRRKYSLIGLIVLIIPLLAFSFYSYFFIQPRQDAYIAANEYFMKNNFSSVVEELAPHEPEDMPYVVQYQLAVAYVNNETLGDSQKRTILNGLTLQTDPQYFLYWSYIGRGMEEEAIDVARSLEDRDLIMMALLQYTEAIKRDPELTGEEKQMELDQIEQELEEYDQERVMQEEAEQEEQEEEQNAEEEPAEEENEEADAQPESEEDAEETESDNRDDQAAADKSVRGNEVV